MSLKEISNISRDEWAEVAQLGELEYHKTPNWRHDDSLFRENNDKLFRNLGFSSDDFKGAVICDYGAGSRLRAKFFDAYIVAIEPLADRFIEEVPWCDLKSAQELYNMPAEDLVPGLNGRVDFLFSINVLDHCFDFERCIDNAISYMKSGGTMFLAFDCHERTDELHPIVVNEAICVKMFFDKGLRIHRMMRIEPFHAGIAKYALAFFMTC